VIISALNPQGAVLIAQARSSYGMSQPLVQATQGVTSPAAFATNVGDAAALKDFYYSDVIVDQPDSTRLKADLRQVPRGFPDRKIERPTWSWASPPRRAVVNALDKAGRDLTRETFVNALEDLTLSRASFSGPVAFSAQASRRRPQHQHPEVRRQRPVDRWDVFLDGSRAQ